MIYKNSDVLRMNTDDFSKLISKKIRIETSKDYELNSGEKACEFYGYIKEIGLAVNASHPPVDILFIENALTDVQGIRIYIFDIELLDTLD